MFGLLSLTALMGLLAYNANIQYDLPFVMTFLELLSGPIAMNWGIPPAAGGGVGYVMAVFFLLIYLGGALWSKPMLRGIALICWGFFGFMGAFMYAA